MNKNLILNVGVFFLAFLVGVLCTYLMLNNEPTLENTTITEVETTSITDLYEATVLVEKMSDGYGYGHGSGFFYQKDENNYYIVTNQHVIVGAEDIEIETHDEERYKVTVVDSNAYLDIAILKLESTEDFKLANIGDSEKTNVGDKVYAIGAPYYLDYKFSVTSGVISYKYRYLPFTTPDYYGDFDGLLKTIQSDVGISPGNSGGPMSDENGNVIGIVTRETEFEDSNGLAFAIPINDAINYIDGVINNNEYIFPEIGFEYLGKYESFYEYGFEIDYNVDYNGVVITTIDEDSDAYKKGLRPGDMIIKYNNFDITGQHELRYYTMSSNIGDTVTLEVYKDKEVMEIEVLLQ